ncbi:MAG: transglycosylase domain-containing protein, partial [Thiotrichaceae bacterium]
MLWLTWINRFIRWVLGPALLLLTLGIVGLVFVWSYYTPQLPSEEELKNSVSLQLPLRVYSKEKKLIAEFGQYRRRPVKIAEVPENLTHAFIAIEDSRFYQHKGVDFYGVARAFVAALKTRKISQGASTITMQVARNFFLDRRKKLERKIKEIFLANKIERIFSKDEIMELYLNKIFLGKRSYGVGSAAEVYYGKKVDELTLAQSAMIAGLPKAPSAYNPVINPKRAKIRRDYILQRMLTLKYIDQAEYNDAKAEPLTAKIHARAKTETAAPYIAEMARQDVISRFGEDLVYRTGMKVYTTIDSAEQENAVSTLRKHLIKYHKRHGYRGPEEHIELDEFSTTESLQKKISSYATYANLIPAVVTASSASKATLQTSTGETVTLRLKRLKWARQYINESRRGKTPKKVSDVLVPGDIVRVSQNEDKSWSLTPLPLISGAIVSMNPENGAVLSAVGGFDYHQTKFNRATQAKRQPGS